ncbi:hypothetical protein DV711_02845 [Motiliproteus coralliicola]|uniref:Uncharacterized protein n=1 Tax=Motiliproteus coralliicola TaxID=2283196 RepID=A0A369WS83_9GAMM|nr:hypothetical protein [Motiliproteus coralliicola]RDE24542.1 hypothetical protein DV711_02845 [Motiliproteus coralliicola]
MISTSLYELAHRLRSQGQANQALIIDRSDFESLQQELSNMHCLRALRALRQEHPSYGGMALVIQEGLAI